MTEPITSQEPPYVFRDKLLERGLHFDFLRLRCGSEHEFYDAVRNLDFPREQRPRSFIAFSEWDAVLIMPCRQLYPRSLNAFYGSESVAASIAGTAGYFAYLWDHPVNQHLDDKLDAFEQGGIALVVSLRFTDAFRGGLGLGGELLLCDYVEHELRQASLSGLVAHTLGWNDVVLIIHAEHDPRRLVDLLSRLRQATARDLVENADALFEDEADAAIFAASYTHLIGGYGLYLSGAMTLGNLTDDIAQATLLVRVEPFHEAETRSEIARLSSGKITAEDTLSEMGHYSFSADLTALATRDGAADALQIIAGVRDFIGTSSGGLASSYPETSTILCFREQPRSTPARQPRIDTDVAAALHAVSELMRDLRRNLESRGASPMTIHRFSAVAATLMDHLSDPVRSSVVRHMARFLVETTRIIPELDREQIEDLCHICEYALTQATDGIAQFQHDANALGLTGRGGYSRIILAVEMYVQDILDLLRVSNHILITFGLRTGHAGASGRYQIDVPFNVVFVPSRWYVLLHEAAHIAWVETFSWMGETLADYDRMERTIVVSRKGMPDELTETERRMEFIRAREIIREFFPNFLVYRLACGSDRKELDRLSLRHILSNNRHGSGTREMLIAVVLHALFDLLDGADGDHSLRGRAWWEIWIARSHDVPGALRRAIAALGVALTQEETKSNGSSGQARSHKTIPAKKRLLDSEPFFDAAKDALESAIDVLAQSARSFTRGDERTPGLAETLFKDLQEGIDVALDEQRIAENWPAAGFAEWMREGEVFALAPGAHVWSRLLLSCYEEVKEATESGGFMLSQLSPILALWHRAVTTTEVDDLRSKRILKTRLYPHLVRKKSLA